MGNKDDLQRELDRLREHLPGWAARMIDAARRPGAVWVRIPLAIALVAGVKKVVVIMEHTAKDEPKLLHKCNLPLTGAGVVDMVITDLGVFSIDRKKGGMTLIELAPGVTVDEITKKTEASFTVDSKLKH